MKLIFLILLVVIECKSHNCPKADNELIDFGKQNLEKYYGVDEIKKYNPYKITRMQKGIVLIEGTLSKNLLGGVPVIKINTYNCQVLEYYHTK